MRVDVSLIPGEVAPKDVTQSTVVIIDVLRATSTITSALSQECEEVIPTESIEEAITIARGYARADIILGGERRGVAVEGFDLGNSPQEYSRDRVAHKKVILTTTNGTHVIKAYGGAREILVACFLNADAVSSAISASVSASASGGSDDAEVLLVCSGQEGRFCMEDTLCAGLLASRLSEELGGELSDSARAAASLWDKYKDSIEAELFRSDHGAYLASIGFEQDVKYCARRSTMGVVPKVYDRRVIRRAPAAQRGD